MKTTLLTLLGAMKLEKVMIFPGNDTVNSQALLSKGEGRIVSIMSTLIPKSQDWWKCGCWEQVIIESNKQTSTPAFT
ncbi:hypothetical protein PSTT_00163 [Puccinia striiformis]|uniref:Uncharacterized protein n=1 Tax=Puccinia striiformis TaxID=27350 RepID=A0A2S4W8I1_9BASI|nr:hypothetical protein PSTT_00163 [Puccinia striiformis]